MKHFVILIILLVSTLHLHADTPNYSIVKALWNKERSTLDVVISGDNVSIEKLYANYHQFDFSLNDNDDFDLVGIEKGIANIHEDRAVLPNKILIIIDQGEYNDSTKLLNDYIQFASEIMAKHPLNTIFEICLLSSQVSRSTMVSKYTLQHSIIELLETIHSGEPTQYKRLFKTTDFTQYKKLFVLSNGMSGEFESRGIPFDEIINSSILGNTQVIPVSNEEKINKEWFGYLNSINQISIDRPSFSYIPKGEMRHSNTSLEKTMIVLSYKQTLESPLQNNVHKITLNYIDGDFTLFKNKNSILSLFTNKIANTKVETVKGSFKKSLIFGIILCLFIYYITPLYNRISFKNNNVHTYSKIKIDGQNHTDPLKMTKIKDEDIVVQIGQQVMLLDSWKYIKDNMSNPKYAKEYRHFFNTGIDENIFQKQTGIFKYALAIWLSAVGSLVLGVLYIITKRNILIDITTIDIKEIVHGSYPGEFPLLANFIITSSTLTILISLIAAARWFYNKEFNIVFILLKVTVGIIFSALLLYATSHIITYEIVFTKINLLFLIAIAIFGSLVTINTSELKPLLSNIVKIMSGVVVVYILLGTELLNSYLSENVIFQLFNFVFFSLFLCVYVSEQEDDNLLLGLKVDSPAEIENDIYHLEQHFQNDIIKSFSIGSNPNADLYVKWPDVDIKMNHAIIEKDKDQFIITPKDGAVYINQQEIKDTAVIAANDEIKLSESSISQFTIINL